MSNVRKALGGTLFFITIGVLGTANVLAASTYTFKARGNAISKTSDGAATSSTITMKLPTSNATGKPYVSLTVDAETEYHDVVMKIDWRGYNLGIAFTKDTNILYDGQLGNPTKSQITTNFTNIITDTYTFSKNNYSGKTFFRFQCTGATDNVYIETQASFTNWSY